MKRITLAILITLFIASPSFAATYYGVNAGGNWGTAATFSTIATKDATRVGGAVLPTASDDVILDDYSGNITVNVTTAVAKTLNCTSGGNYAGTLTFTAGQQLALSGYVTFASTMTLAGTGTLKLNTATVTVTTAGLTFPGDINFVGFGTFTLANALIITGTMTLSSSITFAGAYNITAGTLSVISNVSTSSFVAGQTLTITTAINAAIAGFGLATIKSATGGSDTILTYQGTAANCKIAGITFTDVHADGSAQAIDNWYGAVTGTTTGINVRTSASIGGGGSAWAW